ncbi:Holliday junction resolvase RuvX [Pseudoroseomonas globiformis]|uniref:Putative pre-16S rRNA nuclease n=1 Tax=Teichococcus globiformis TaxID=2307229 RepID=A0ABV7G2M8_9PROT
MPIINLTELRAALSPGQRLIGLDPGKRVIGLALSDPLLILATPYGSLQRGKLAANAAQIRAMAEKEGAAGLVVGLPLSLDGSFGPAAQAAKDWAMAVSVATEMPVSLWDERLSSSAVNRMLVEEADLSRAKRMKIVDSAAAGYMLQAALDASRSVGDSDGAPLSA